MDKNYNISACAVLCEFNASVWTARKLDKKQTANVIAGANAKSSGAARVNKNLLSGRKELEEITELVTDARGYVYAQTMPWSDNGQRLLISARLPKFDERMLDFRDKFDAKVQEFITVYPTLITAQAMALGDMFDRDEYPPPDTIAHKFSMSCEYYPVPEAGHFAVDVANSAQDELRERLTHSGNQRVLKAQADLTARFKEHLQRMADRLVTVQNAKGEDTSKRFTDTLVSGAFELCDMVQDYNITGDQTLTNARRTLEELLTGVTVNTLRGDPSKREDVRKAATTLLNQFTF